MKKGKYQHLVKQGRKKPVFVFLANKIHGMGTPTGGCFYALRFPDEWGLYVGRDDICGGAMSHREFWEECVAPILAGDWAIALNKRPEELEEALKGLYYGFPRGRVIPWQGQFWVSHGSDLARFFTRAEVKAAFSLEEAVWIHDDHERCYTPSKKALRKILRIKEDWTSTDDDPTAA